MRIALISSIYFSLSVRRSTRRFRRPVAAGERRRKENKQTRSGGKSWEISFNFLSISWSFISFLPLLGLPHVPSWRRNDNAEFFHHIERLPQHTTRRLESDGYEHMGRCLHVLHLCIAARVRVCQLRGKKAPFAQRRLSAGRESRYSGK